MSNRKIPQIPALSTALNGTEEFEIARGSVSYRLTSIDLFKAVGILPATSGNPVPASGFRIPLFRISDGASVSCSLDQALTIQGGVPAGGTTGQALVKASATDYDTTWAAVATVTSVNASGGTTGLTFSGGPITTSGTLTLAGTLAVANGGTGQTTAVAAFDALAPTTTRGDLIARGASVNGRLAIGASGTLLRSDGIDPSWQTVSTVLDTIGSTRGQVLYRGAATWAALSAGTSGHLLRTNGAGADPSWVNGATAIDINSLTALQDYNPSTDKLIVYDTSAGDNKSLIENILVRYGADVSGVSDSTAAFQAAVDSGYGEIELPPSSTIRINGTVTITLPVVIRGTGMDPTNTGTADANIVTSGTSNNIFNVNSDNVTFENINIVGTLARTAAGQGRAIAVGTNYSTVTDGAINVVTDATKLNSATANWVIGDIGKYVTIPGAGAAGARLNALITARNSATQVTISPAASTTVSGQTVNYGHIYEGCTFRNVSTSSHSVGIEFLNAASWMIDNCYLQSYDSLHVRCIVNADAGDSSIQAGLLAADASAGKCIYWRSSGALKVTAVKFLDAQDHISIDWSWATSGGPIVTGCSFENVARYFFHATGDGTALMNGSNVTGNWFNGSGSVLFDNAAGTGWFQRLNWIGNTHTSSSVATLLDIGRALDGFFLAGNTIDGGSFGGATGINVRASAANGNVYGNRFVGLATNYTNSSASTRMALPVDQGGTGLTSGTSGGILYYSAAGTLASTGALTLYGLMVGGGVGGSPGALASIGTTTQVLHGNAAGQPTWGAVQLGAGGDVTGTLSVANGGTGITSFGTGIATWLGTPSSANLAAAVTDETGTGSLVFATTPTLTTPILGTPTSGTLTNCTGLPISTGVSGLGTGVATFLATASSANLASAVSDETGTGSLVFANTPTLVTPVLGTPTSGTLTNCTGLPISTGVSGLGTGVATFLATPSSANLASAVTDETGSGALVFGTSPTLATPTFTTSATGPLLIGGTGASSTLTLQSTSGVGTSDSIVFKVGNNGATTAMSINTSGNITANVTLGVGAASPTAGVPLYVRTATDHNLEVSNTGGGIGIQVLNNARDTYQTLAFTAVSSAFNSGGTTALSLDSSANATFGRAATSSHATSGIGYSTGAGGTVTQATSKSTGVTLNNVCGTITMNNASLAATTTVGFTLTNSSIAATDVVVAAIKSGATANSYSLTVGAVAAGSCLIELRNGTGGALAEAVVLSFAVMKAVAA